MIPKLEYDTKLLDFSRKRRLSREGKFNSLKSKKNILRDYNNKLNCPLTRQIIWQLISEDSACDARVRLAGMQLWRVLFGDVEFDRDNKVAANVS